MKKDKQEYPNDINPNANSSGTLAIERAKLAMSLSDYDSPDAIKLRNELLDQDDPGEEK